MDHDPNPLMTAAIRDLGAWKMHLETAVDTGYCAISSEQAHDQHGCELGQWLAQENGAEFDRIKQLHAALHSIAGDILRYVELGELEEANVLYETDLLEISAAFVPDLRRWASSQMARSA